MNSEAANGIVGGTKGNDKSIALKWFISGAAMILAITGVAKVWTALGNAKLLTVGDPVVGIQFKYLML